MSKQTDEYRRKMGMNMTTGANNMADMQFSIRRPMQEERDRQKLLEAYFSGVAVPSKLAEAYAQAAVTGLPVAYRFDPATGKVEIITYQELVGGSEFRTEVSSEDIELHKYGRDLASRQKKLGADIRKALCESLWRDYPLSDNADSEGGEP